MCLLEVLVEVHRRLRRLHVRLGQAGVCCRIEASFQTSNLLLQSQDVALHLTKRIGRALKGRRAEVVTRRWNPLRVLALQRLNLSPHLLLYLQSWQELGFGILAIVGLHIPRLLRTVV